MSLFSQLFFLIPTANVIQNETHAHLAAAVEKSVGLCLLQAAAAVAAAAAARK